MFFRILRWKAKDDNHNVWRVAEERLFEFDNYWYDKDEKVISLFKDGEKVLSHCTAGCDTEGEAVTMYVENNRGDTISVIKGNRKRKREKELNE